MHPDVPKARRRFAAELLRVEYRLGDIVENDDSHSWQAILERLSAVSICFLAAVLALKRILVLFKSRPPQELCASEE